MKRAVAVLGLALVLAGPVSALEPVRTGQENFISRAVFAQGKLWVLNDAGQLFTIEEGKTGRNRVPLPEDAVDLWIREGKPAIATCWGKHCDTWNLRQQQGDSWSEFARVQSDRLELLSAVIEADGASILLTDHRVIEVRKGEKWILPLQVPERRGLALVASVLARSDKIFVGINAGEWGGGLRAIDRKSGAVTTIEANTNGELCGGPLNIACDPVNGLAAEPSKPACVLAAVGLVHFLPHGRIAEICDTSVQTFYSHNLPCPEDKPGMTTIGCTENPQTGERSIGTEAFFGMVRTKDTVWAVGIDGLYKISERGVEHIGKLPKFKNYGGTWASFDVPGLVLVLTEINQRRSISGAVPLIVSRGDD